MTFKELNMWDRHHSTEPHRLVRDDDMIEATWDSFHGAYSCKVFNTITGKESWASLTDADLGRAEVIYGV